MFNAYLLDNSYHASCLRNETVYISPAPNIWITFIQFVPLWLTLVHFDLLI